MLGNFLLFMPAGLLLPALFPKLRSPLRFALLMLGLLIGVEVLQLLLRQGSCDIDDVILNLAGALLVFALCKLPRIDRALTRAHIFAAYK